MKFQRGKSGNPAGRTLGTVNRYTWLRHTVLQAFQKLGGERWLLKVARDDPKTFLGLLGRILPKPDREWDSTTSFWCDDDDGDDHDGGPQDERRD